MTAGAFAHPAFLKPEHFEMIKSKSMLSLEAESIEQRADLVLP